VCSSDLEHKRKEIIQDLSAAKGKSFPEKLFHYTNMKGVGGIVQSNHLWATDFRSVNDMTELIYGSDLLASELKRYADESSEDIAKLLNWLSDFYGEHSNTYRNFFEIYIISFSEEPDMLSQWRAYSDHAKGCCIEFDFTDSHLFTIFDEFSPWALEVLPVIYDESSQRKLMRSGIEKLLNYLSSYSLTGFSEVELGIVAGFVIRALDLFALAFKHPGFVEEREWRVIASCQITQTETKKKYRHTDSGTINYLECIFLQGDKERLWQRKLLPITGIKYGPLADVSVKDEINKLLSINGYDNQVVYTNSTIPLRK
jgi:hypothetical protein